MTFSLVPSLTLALALARPASVPTQSAGFVASIQCEAVVAASPDKVWAAFTTKEGLEAWMVGHASFDLRIGGLMRTRYAKEGKLGDEGTIENEILAYDPGRMLSIRVAKAPANFPFKNAVRTMWTVVYFDPVEGGQTRVRCVGLGFTPDEESQQMRKHFEAGNKWTVDKLAAHFKK